MRKLLTVFGVAAALSVAPLQAQAQAWSDLMVGPTVAYSDKGAGIGIGATVLFGLENFADNLGFMGDFLFFFPDGYDLWEVNTNLTYDFPLENTTIVPFGLGGLNIAHSSATKVNFNLGAGAAFDAGSFRPRVGFRFALGDGTRFVAFATLPFRVGGGS